MQEVLIQQIKKYVQVSREEEQLLNTLFKTRKLRRKHLLIQEGEVSYYSSYVISGILRLYSIDKNGFEHVIQFAPAGWWIGDMQSILSHEPGNLYIDAIEDSEILQILKSDLDSLFDTHPKFERFFRILAENAVAAYQQRFVSSLGLSAKERYLNFCSLYPTLILQLPQKYIASYIGVTPEFLSKIQNQTAHKKKDQ